MESKRSAEIDSHEVDRKTTVFGTNDKTIGTYIGYLCNAYGFYRI